jgi:argininosuccinate lyase
VERELGDTSKVSREEIRRALRAENFVAVRKIAGGPALEALEPEIDRAREQISADERWLGETRRKLVDAREKMSQESRELLRRVDGR